MEHSPGKETQYDRWIKYRRLYGNRACDLPVVETFKKLIKDHYNPIGIIENPNSFLENLRKQKKGTITSEVGKDTDKETELDLIEEHLRSLKGIPQPDDNNRLNINMRDIYISRAEKLLNKLRIVKDSKRIPTIKYELRKEITSATYGSAMKKIPKFVYGANGSIEIDIGSDKWTPSFYIMNNALSVLSTWLKDQDIIDPFAGAGSSSAFLAATGIPRAITCSDIRYHNRVSNGKKFPKKGDYAVEINLLMNQFMFEKLPPWCQPEIIQRIKGIDHFDATDLPYPPESFDYIFSDPPYGENLEKGGADFFLDVLDKLLKVTKKGGIFLVPIKWRENMTSKQIRFEELTNDLSSGFAYKIPTQIIYIPKQELIANSLQSSEKIA